MPTFDEQLTCQLGFVLGPGISELPIGKLSDFSEQIEGEIEIYDQSIDVRFGDPQIGQTLVVNTGETIQTATWSSEESALPKLQLSPARFDFFIDCLQVEESTGEHIDLSTIANSVSQRMISGIQELDTLTNRLVCVINCIGSESENPNPEQYVANQFFNVEIQEAIDSYRDLRGRTNLLEEWELGPLVRNGDEMNETDIFVHVIDDGQANWVIEDEEPETKLEWKIDINTTPEVEDEAGYKDENIQCFFEQALGRASSKLNNLRG